MKFTYFHLMPYAGLPDDFEKRFSSPSLTYPNGYFDPELGVELYHRYLDELELADELGFDGIAVNEHHQSAYGLMPSPNLMAAALARRTSNARLMVLGNAIGIRGNPLRVAEEIAMLDHLSRGRVVSGFVRGIGWEYFAHSVNPTRSRARFEEAHDLIIKAWTTREPFQWVSPNYEFRYVNVWPRPLQQPHPPIYIPGAGSTETMRWVAQHQYSYMSVYAPSSLTKRWFDGYRSASEEAGIDPDPEKIVFSVPLYVAETDELAHAQARGPVEWLFHKGLKQGFEIIFPPGYMTPGSMRGMLSSGFAGFENMSYEDLLREHIVIAGSPDTVGETLEQLRDTLGFGSMNVLMCIGDMPHERVVSSMELFAGKVMPALR
ncbi:MAG TPA: LLM class flavin-dependent oxidoreductase [Solirubrobacteraceae bacterium]|jgi:alkanesulfonate monooxygenase SsuD/methylene tetrahydromethanopterin reductase-like flavin-dependent oxidoreductase (luciferase family)|nr:LLM class flavin-dependent oxidoreductase [Solirubrobacteraceae bacterium]